MNNIERDVDYTLPVDILALFQNEFGACGCSNIDAMVIEARELLLWIDSTSNRAPCYNLFNGNAGVFYLLVGLMDHCEYCEHGVSIRSPFLTDKGKKLLSALLSMPAGAIENASGVAYDGLWYGKME